MLFEDAAGHLSRVLPALTSRRARRTWDMLIWARQHGYAPQAGGAIAIYRVERRRIAECVRLPGGDAGGEDFDPNAGVREPRRPRMPQSGASARPGGE